MPTLTLDFPPTGATRSTTGLRACGTVSMSDYRPPPSVPVGRSKTDCSASVTVEVLDSSDQVIQTRTVDVCGEGCDYWYADFSEPPLPAGTGYKIVATLSVGTPPPSQSVDSIAIVNPPLRLAYVEQCVPCEELNQLRRRAAAAAAGGGTDDADPEAVAAAVADDAAVAAVAGTAAVAGAYVTRQLRLFEGQVPELNDGEKLYAAILPVIKTHQKVWAGNYAVLGTPQPGRPLLGTPTLVQDIHHERPGQPVRLKRCRIVKKPWIGGTFLYYYRVWFDMDGLTGEHVLMLYLVDRYGAVVASMSIPIGP